MGVTAVSLGRAVFQIPSVTVIGSEYLYLLFRQVNVLNGIANWKLPDFWTVFSSKTLGNSKSLAQGHLSGS